MKAFKLDPIKAAAIAIEYARHLGDVSQIYAALDAGQALQIAVSPDDDAYVAYRIGRGWTMIESRYCRQRDHRLAGLPATVRRLIVWAALPATALLPGMVAVDCAAWPVTQDDEIEERANLIDVASFVAAHGSPRASDPDQRAASVLRQGRRDHDAQLIQIEPPMTGGELAALRTGAGLTQAELADLTGQARKTVTRHESGDAIPAAARLLYRRILRARLA